MTATDLLLFARGIDALIGLLFGIFMRWRSGVSATEIILAIDAVRTEPDIRAILERSGTLAHVLQSLDYGGIEYAKKIAEKYDLRIANVRRLLWEAKELARARAIAKRRMELILEGKPDKEIMRIVREEGFYQ